MALSIRKYYLTNNDCYKTGAVCTKIGLQLHTIGTGQGTAQSVADYWNQPGIEACVHYIVDCDTVGKVLQTLPEDYRSWADAGYGNNNLITFEICESDAMKYTQGASYQVTDEIKFKADILRGYRTAVDLCAKVCLERGWEPESKLQNGLHLISSHDEGRKLGTSSAHVDPTHIWDRFGLSMTGFRADVKAAMAQIENSFEGMGNATTENDSDGSYEAGDSTENGSAKYTVQCGAFSVRSNAEALVQKLQNAGFEAFIKY